MNVNVNWPRVCTYRASPRRSRSRSQPAAPAGNLAPWADPLTGTPGWQVRSASRRLAASFGAAQTNGKEEWQAQIPQSALTVTVIRADESALLLTLGPEDSDILTLTVKPWTLRTVLKCQPEELPTHGTLSVRDVRVTTRMGRIVRYLIPEFRPP